MNGRKPGRRRHGGRHEAPAVGLSFSDNLKPWTINKTTLPIRVKANQAVVDGYYSYQLNIVNFRPTPAVRARHNLRSASSPAVSRIWPGTAPSPSTATFITAPREGGGPGL